MALLICGLPGSSFWAPRIVFLGSKDRLLGLRGSSKGGGCFLKGSNAKREQIKNEFRALSDLVTSLPQHLSFSISQISHLSSLPLTSERARQKFLGVGGCPGQTPRIFSRAFSIFVRTSSPLQLSCSCVQMHQKMCRWQDIVGGLSEETWLKSWRHVSSPHSWKD